MQCEARPLPLPQEDQKGWGEVAEMRCLKKSLETLHLCDRGCLVSWLGCRLHGPGALLPRRLSLGESSAGVSRGW